MSKAEPTQGETSSDLPAGLAQPAIRALTGAGYLRLEQLTTVTEAEIKKLHGIGPNALKQLRAALAARNLSFAGGEIHTVAGRLCAGNLGKASSNKYQLSGTGQTGATCSITKRIALKCWKIKVGLPEP